MISLMWETFLKINKHNRDRLKVMENILMVARWGEVLGESLEEFGDIHFMTWQPRKERNLWLWPGI